MYYPGLPFCKNCGQEGHKRNTCPESPCKYCRQSGHIIQDCPQCPVCPDCGLKGHDRKCPQHPFQRQQQQQIAQNPNPRQKPKGGRSNLLTSFPSHLQPSLVVNKDTTVSSAALSSLCPEVIFPPIIPTLTHLLETLTEQNHEDLRHIPYKQVIEAMGGVKSSAILLSEKIHPLVKDFEGKVVTTQMLHRVREEQAATVSWEQDSGYLSYISDSRVSEYWRPYVGQSSSPIHRIKQHLKAVMNRETTTLHYKIVADGAGYRAINFIKLWTLIFPEYAEGHVTLSIVFANIMEMSMARAFQSLAPGILGKYFGDARYSGTGLNVVPPLLQGISLSPAVRYSYSLQLEDSPDPEIRAWPQFRKKLRDEAQSSLIPKGPRPTREGYLEILRSAASTKLGLPDLQCMDTTITLAKIPFNMEKRLRVCAEASKHSTGQTRSFVLPRGRMEAQIGLILDQSSYLADSKRMAHGALGQCKIPWGINESGFSKENSLIWPFSLSQEALNISASHQFKHPTPEETEAIGKFNHDLIKASNLRVIIFSDIEVVTCLNLGPAIDLELRGIGIKAYVELDDDKSRIKRVYIHSPSSPSFFWANTGRQIARICEIFWFTGVTLACEAIRPTFYDSANCVIRIIRRYDDERQGKPPMTADSMDSSIRSWLYLQGFRTSDSIKQLQEIGGSLATSIFMLLVSLPRRPYGTVEAPEIIPSHGRKRSGQRVFSKQKIQSIRDLYEELQKERKNEPQSCPTKNHEATDELDLDELEDIVDAEKQDDLERTGASITSSINGKLQLKVERVSLPNTDVEVRMDHVYKGLREQEIKTRTSLLSGRYYEGFDYMMPAHNTTDYTTSVHTFIRLRLPGYFKKDNKKGMLVQVEMAPVGKRAPREKAFVPNARDDDPGSRLAFRVLVKDPKGVDKTVYPKAEGDGESHIFKANSLVDWMDGATNDIIATRCRRYIQISKDARSVSENLEYFKGGGYILDDFSRDKKLPQKRARPKDSDEESQPQYKKTAK